ncbi:hypothetical protein C8D88_11683 [Lentzea atacamensis]|uniref:Uncharacterized protein n=1 Tax=Lentzea atacamensis TaxID=531938 RepID=A0A316HTR9_9PSEU|nr:hypothetical protein [Lentzea atacamensis]PWK81672.1 hypothetical protein C8D88_11683 [Lentzea atacamensis]
MSEVLNPVQVEQSIRSLANSISRCVTVVSNAETKAREARRAYDLAFAHAYMDWQGAAHEKLEAADVAELAYKHAERTARALTEELRAWQSVGASVRAMYQTPGGMA